MVARNGGNLASRRRTAIFTHEASLGNAVHRQSRSSETDKRQQRPYQLRGLLLKKGAE